MDGMSGCISSKLNVRKTLVTAPRTLPFSGEKGVHCIVKLSPIDSFEGLR